MAARRSSENVKWFSINDFRPGIVENLSGQYPPGTADPSGTFRCGADATSGTLIPLRGQYTFTIQWEVDDIDPGLPGNIDSDEIRLIGLKAVGPIYETTNLSTGVDQNNTEIFVAIEWWDTTTSMNLEVWRFRRHYGTTPTWQQVWSFTDTTQTYAATTRPRTFTFGIGRSNNADPNVSGPTAVWWVGDRHARFFPDDTNTDAVGTVALPGDSTSAVNTPTQIVFPSAAVGHQGRVVIMPLTIVPFGSATNTFVHNESMYWTAFNDFRTHGITPERWGDITVGAENPTGYGALASLSADELFLVKRGGGAVMIAGAVAGVGPTSPTTRTLPYVRSTGLSYNTGTPCALGFVYPVDGDGVWMWQGGDFSQKISKQFNDGDFWRVPATNSQGADVDYGWPATQCAAARSYVLLPNNWLFDTDLGTWWRVEDPDVWAMHRWTASERERHLYGTRSGLLNTADGLVREYDLTAAACHYSWKSQPMAHTIDKVIAIREIVVVASGVGEVTIQCGSGTEVAGATRTIAVNSTVPVAKSVSYDIRGSHIWFKVTSAGDDYATAAAPDYYTGVEPAPKIHEIRYAVQELQPIAASYT